MCPVPVAVSTDMQEVGAVQVMVPGVGTGACLVAGAGLPSFLHLLLGFLSGWFVRQAQELVLQGLFH